MKLRIPKKLHRGTPKKMTDEMIEEGALLLNQGNSERFVARRLGVSRATVRIHCRKGWKELFRKRYKCYSYVSQNPNYLESARRNVLRRYHILCDLYPKKMKTYRKKVKKKIGKKYFRDYMRKWREKHPHYSRDYMRKLKK